MTKIESKQLDKIAKAMNKDPMLEALWLLCLRVHENTAGPFLSYELSRRRLKFSLKEMGG